MSKYPSNDLTDGIGDTTSNHHSLEDSLDVLDAFIGSPLTPTTNVSFSTPHEPTQRQSIIECFDTLLTLLETEEADCYDSDGNKAPCVKDNEFEHFESSIDEISGGEISQIPSSSKFVQMLKKPLLDQMDLIKDANGDYWSLLLLQLNHNAKILRFWILLHQKMQMQME